MRPLNKKIRVLHTPRNVASFISETVYGLNKINGVSAKGVVYNEDLNIFVSMENVISRKQIWGSNRNPIIFLKKTIFSVRYIFDIFFSDIIHWYWDNGILPNNLDLKIIRILKKPLIIEWLGSEIRNPEIEKKINEYYKNIFDKGYEYAYLESEKSSKELQLKFSSFGAYPILTRGASIAYHVDKSLFREVFLTRHRINTSKYIPNYPGIDVPRPKIIHSPTARICKGTEYVEKVIKSLSAEYSFEFELLENMTRDDVKKKLEECDIYVDQFILGGHGMATVEAMALGKPVLCYLHEKSLEELPDECPIINASIDTLEHELRKLIINSTLRYEVGKKSRQYVEKYLDSTELAKELLEIYKTVIKKNNVWHSRHNL